ncbi:MAG: DUF3837 domain-containing protein [Lachnospiraceae bacterium]
MIPLLARQSVILKCNLKKSQLLGNYEFYYAAGLLAKLMNVEAADLTNPQDVWNQITEAGKNYQTEDEKEQHLLSMVRNYQVHDEFDEQMQELFECGKKESYMWQVNVPTG